MMRLLLVAAMFAGCGDGSTGLAHPRLRAVEIASGLTNPVYLTPLPGDDRLFIVEQEGRIRIQRDLRTTGTSEPLRWSVTGRASRCQCTSTRTRRAVR